jgi:hypothetical protein
MPVQTGRRCEDARVAFLAENVGQRIETNDAGEATSIDGAGGEGREFWARLESGTYFVKCRPRNGAPG